MGEAPTCERMSAVGIAPVHARAGSPARIVPRTGRTVHGRIARRIPVAWRSSSCIAWCCISPHAWHDHIVQPRTTVGMSGCTSCLDAPDSPDALRSKACHPCDSLIVARSTRPAVDAWRMMHGAIRPEATPVFECSGARHDATVLERRIMPERIRTSTRAPRWSLSALGIRARLLRTNCTGPNRHCLPRLRRSAQVVRQNGLVHIRPLVRMSLHARLRIACFADTLSPPVPNGCSAELSRPAKL